MIVTSRVYLKYFISIAECFLLLFFRLLLLLLRCAEGIVQESICGRPLGLAFDTIGNNLIVADAYYGIWSVDLATGKKTQLISPTEELDGKVHKFIISVVIVLC